MKKTKDLKKAEDMKKMKNLNKGENMKDMKKTKNAANGGVFPVSRVEEECKYNKYFREAKFLLETFNENRMKRRVVEEEIRKGRRFTRDDAIYMISGVKAVQYNSDRVQSSPKADVMADRVSEIDEVVERMNREASKELRQEFNKLSGKVTLVNIGLTEMDIESRKAVKQRYVDGVPVDELMAPDGRKYHYRTALKLIHQGIDQFAQYLALTETIRREAEAAEKEKNEYMEEWYD